MISDRRFARGSRVDLDCGRNTEGSVIRGPRAIAYFDGGPNAQDQKADYEFWMMESTCKPIPGRYPAGHNPAARFRDLAKQRNEHPLYEKAWHCAQSATLIRYATKEEVEGWLTAHAVDAKYANRGARIGTQTFEVKEVNGVYRLV
jgi:hypothetical protein